MSETCCVPKKKPFYQNKLFLIAILGLFSIVITLFIPGFSHVSHYFLKMLSLVWWAMGLGFLIGGIIDYYVPQRYIKKLLSKNDAKTLFLSVFLGTLLSTCCHGILAIAMQLYKKGASIAAVITLLMAAPWANFPMTILMVVFFGVKGMIIIGLAILIALIVGFIFQLLDKANSLNRIEFSTDDADMTFSIRDDLKKRYHDYKFSKTQCVADLKGIFSGAWSLMKMVLWWFLIAMVVSSYISAFVPHGFIDQYFSSNLLGLLSTLLATSLIEICSEGSSVLAFELYNQTGSIAHVFVFLLAGVATDFTEIGLIWTTVGKRTALLIPIISVPIILFFAYWLLFI